jgi:predicted permease
MWSVGLTYFTKAPDKKTLVKKVATHPCILAVAIGLVIMIGQIELPGFLTLTIKNVAAGNTFLAMALIGLILSEVNVREMVDKETLYYSFVRLILIPLLVMICCRLAHLDSLVTGVCVVLSAMPAASVTAAMATKYEKDEIFATKCVVLSTILSMVTVPVWCMILG